MTRHFLVAGPGDVRDISFREKRKLGAGDESPSVMYSVYVGAERWGTVATLDGKSWEGCSYAGFDNPDRKPASLPGGRSDENTYRIDPREATRTMRGFGSRRAAAAHVVKHHGYWENN